MVAISNIEFFNNFLQALYTIARRRTSQRYADETIASSIDWMKDDFDFFNAIQIKEYNAVDDEMNIQIQQTINSVNDDEIGRALSSFVRLLYTEMNAEVGLYFLTELRDFMSKSACDKLLSYDIDLDQIQNEQHLLYLKREKLRKAKAGKTDDEDENQLGYTWNNVQSWKHEPGSPFCVLYDKNGKVLDRINLDRVIQHYVEKLSGVAETEYKEHTELQRKVEIMEKDYTLLEMMHSQDMDADQAAHLLHVTEDELNEMIRKLTRVEMIHFTAHDTVELTDKALSYLSERKKDGKA